jgi:hypothetical protein
MPPHPRRPRRRWPVFPTTSSARLAEGAAAATAVSGVPRIELGIAAGA